VGSLPPTNYSAELLEKLVVHMVTAALYRDKHIKGTAVTKLSSYGPFNCTYVVKIDSDINIYITDKNCAVETQVCLHLPVVNYSEVPACHYLT
jgi:hypothetical protein